MLSSCNNISQTKSIEGHLAVMNLGSFWPHELGEENETNNRYFLMLEHCRFFNKLLHYTVNKIYMSAYIIYIYLYSYGM